MWVTLSKIYQVKYNNTFVVLTIGVRVFSVYKVILGFVGFISFLPGGICMFVYGYYLLFHG